MPFKNISNDELAEMIREMLWCETHTKLNAYIETYMHTGDIEDEKKYWKALKKLKELMEIFDK